MVPVLNTIKTDASCVGNHDYDFGVQQFQYLTGKCNFPWLLANVLDPALGENIPLGNAKRTHMMTSSNGIKIGLIGLGEREWLATINSLPPNLIYKSASETAKELVPQLRAEGAEIIICLAHQREPNDNKLAENTGGTDAHIDLILGGHDHHYSHSFIKGTHVLRSGTDFKQLSYLEGRRRKDDASKWDFEISRRDITSEVPEHQPSVELVKSLTSKLQKSLATPIGWTATALDARFSTVRMRESNIGNFVCDIMRSHYEADCAIMAAGTIRGDQIYPPGCIRVKDITTCFPFEDPVIVIRVTGKAIWEALDNGVSTYPALEGRFPQVSNVHFEFDPSLPTGKRVTKVWIGGQPCDNEKKYVLATRGYMGRAKDGFDSLLVQSEGGDAEEIIDEESGLLISTIIRQYFMARRSIGKWARLSAHWNSLADSHIAGTPPVPDNMHESAKTDQPMPRLQRQNSTPAWDQFLDKRQGLDVQPKDDDDSDSEDEVEDIAPLDREVLLTRKYFAQWTRKAKVNTEVCDPVTEAEYMVDWTRTIGPRLEGRIKIVGE